MKMQHFPRGPVVKNPPSNAGASGSIPGQRPRIPRGRATKPTAPQQEKPRTTATRESLSDAMRVQCNQKKKRKKCRTGPLIQKLRFKTATQSSQESVGSGRLSTGPWLYALLTCEASPGLERESTRQAADPQHTNESGHSTCARGLPRWY